jgi:hypothetical protein
MFGEERPTTTLDPDEVKRLAKESEHPRTANGSGGLEPIEDDDNWCEPTRTADPLLQRQLIAASERHSARTPVVTPDAPVATAATPVTAPVTVPVAASGPGVPVRVYLLLALLVLAATGAIAVHVFRLSLG